MANRPQPADLEPLFRQEVFKLLKAHGLPNLVIENRTILSGASSKSPSGVYGQGRFQKANRPNPEDLEPLFQQEVFKLLKAHGLTDMTIENMMGWHNSGFNIYCGPAIWPANDAGLENLARYIIRAAFSQERMTYIPASASTDGQAKVIYQSKNGRDRKVFPAHPDISRVDLNADARRRTRSCS